ncbi:5094_t:CDS:2, partial [Dentiscutata erythropus]
MPSLKKFVAKFTKKSNVATRSIPLQEQIYKDTWSDFDQGEEWNVEEPSGSTSIKEDSEPSSIQVEQKDFSVDLVDGKVRIEDFPLINICLIEDIFYSSDNRRLYCFKEAIKQGLDIDRIPVRIRQNVVVSPSSRNERVIDGEGYW